MTSVASTICQSLPDGDVALEIDGPTHFINTVGSEGRTPTRTLRTELRDLFLKRRHHAVVSVPWFEWAELNLKGTAGKKAFVAEKLKAAGVSVPGSP